jgi:hypothetical protein
MLSVMTPPRFRIDLRGHALRAALLVLALCLLAPAGFT